MVHERQGGVKRPTVICSGSLRTRPVYLSDSSSVVVDTYGATAHRGDHVAAGDVATSRFLLKFQGTNASGELTSQTLRSRYDRHFVGKKGKGSPYSITERRVPELIPVLGSQPAGDVSHKPGGRLPLLSAKPAVTPATLKRAATSFAAW